MLAISDLHVAYGQSEVLHGLNIIGRAQRDRGDHGPQRHGQDHADEVADGIVPTKSGSVNMEGTELSALRSYERVAKGLAYVPQGRMIFSAMTVRRISRLVSSRRAKRKFRAISTSCSRCCSR